MPAIAAANPKPFTHLFLVLTLVTLALTAPRALSQGSIPPGYHIIEYEAPSAGTVPYSGTEVVSINSRGASTGYVIDSGYGTHGFVRNPNGTITVFDAPGANPTIGGTYPLSINDRGVIAGISFDSYAVAHGFLRESGGSFTVFDAPGVSPGTGNYVGTEPQSINARGEIAGVYEGPILSDTDSCAHPTAKSRFSMTPLKASVPTRAPGPTASTTRARSRER